MIYTFEVKGRIPSKKNSKRIISVGGRPILISSKEHKDWYDEQMILLRWNKEPIENIKEITIKFTAPDNRKTDLSNKAESIMDLLVDKRIIKDDNWIEVPKLTLQFLCVNKEFAGAHIVIETSDSS